MKNVKYVTARSVEILNESQTDDQKGGYYFPDRTSVNYTPLSLRSLIGWEEVILVCNYLSQLRSRSEKQDLRVVILCLLPNQPEQFQIQVIN